MIGGQLDRLRQYLMIDSGLVRSKGRQQCGKRTLLFLRPVLVLLFVLLPLLLLLLGLLHVLPLVLLLLPVPLPLSMLPLVQSKTAHAHRSPLLQVAIMACRDLSEIPAQQRLDVVRLLLDAGAEVEARDKYGHTAGRMALELYSSREDSRSVTAAEEHIALRVLQMLLEAGADPLAGDEGGVDMVMAAMRSHNILCLDMILDALRYGPLPCRYRRRDIGGDHSCCGTYTHDPPRPQREGDALPSAEARRTGSNGDALRRRCFQGR